MSNWEYKILALQGSGSELEVNLDSLGSEGWEVVTILTVPGISVEHDEETNSEVVSDVRNLVILLKKAVIV